MTGRDRATPRPWRTRATTHERLATGKPSKLGQEPLGRQQAHSAVLFERKEVPAIAGDEDAGRRRDREGENRVVRRVAGDPGNS